MHFKSKLLAVLAIVACTIGVLLCSKIEKKPVGEENTIETPADNKSTIHFWYDDENMSDYINSAAVAFGETYNARVIPQLVAESEYLEAINHATLYEKNIPDAYLISNDSLEKAYLAGLAVEIADKNMLVTAENFPQTAIDAITYKGKQVAYPIAFETSVLLYNETYLREWALQQVKNEAEEAGVEYDEATLATKRDELMAVAVPTTIDEILSMADSFDPPESVEGIFKWDVSDIFYNYYFVGNYMTVGGDCGDDKTNINIDNAEAIACLEVYKALNQFFYIESESVTYDSVIQDFLDGKLVFTIATTDIVETMERAVSAGTFVYDYGIALIPSPSVQLEGRSLSVTSGIAINGYSKEQELANAFAAFLADEYVEELYNRTGKAAAIRHANADIGALQIFKEEYANSISLNKMIETGNFWIQLEILFSKVWNGGDVNTLVGELAAQIATQVSNE